VDGDDDDGVNDELSSGELGIDKESIGSRRWLMFSSTMTMVVQRRWGRVCVNGDGRFRVGERPTRAGAPRMVGWADGKGDDG
jgi:hypothetical protein